MKFLFVAILFFHNYSIMAGLSSRTFHGSLGIGETKNINSFRVGYKALSFGKLNLNTVGFVMHGFKPPFFAGFGAGYGSYNYNSSAPGIFSEVGLYYDLTNFLAFKACFNNFFNANATLRGELILGLSLHAN